MVTADLEVIDVLISDHAAPTATERLRGRDMVRMEGGTQALRCTVNARLWIRPGEVTTISVPRPLGALVLKAAAYLSDARDRDRHPYDAAALLACMENPFAERDGFAGSDRRRIAAVADALPIGHPAWRALPGRAQEDVQATLRILAAS